MKTTERLLPIACSLLLLMCAACEKELMTENDVTKTEEPTDLTWLEDSGRLTIVTRSTSTETVSYPVTVYIMDSEGTCLRRETIATAGDELSVRLYAGNYQVYAIGGASAEGYSLPAADDATADSEITLKDGAAHADLMTAGSSIKIGRSEENRLTLSFVRKVMMLKSVEVSDIPDDATAVSLSLSPLNKAITLGGNYVSGAQTSTIALEKQSDGTTWKNASTQYLLPSEGASSITVSMTRADNTISYTYSTTQQLQANSELNISGRYTGDAGEFVLSGVFYGPTWAAPTNISFTFSEDGAQGEVSGGGNSTSGEGGSDEAAPALDSWYQNCFVFMSADDDSGEYTVVTLLHRSEVDINTADKSQSDLISEINAALPDFDINGITGWRLPTEDEAKAVRAARVNTNVAKQGGQAMNGDERYFYNKGNDEVGAFWGRGDLAPALTGTMHLRPVTTLRFKKQQ